jgi:hypothetical protein
VRVFLQCEDVDTAAGEGVGESAAAGADLHDEVVGDECRRVDELVGPLRPEEVLTETASPLVPSCPLVRSHGDGPSS